MSVQLIDYYYILGAAAACGHTAWRASTISNRINSTIVHSIYFIIYYLNRYRKLSVYNCTLTA